MECSITLTESYAGMRVLRLSEYVRRGVKGKIAAISSLVVKADAKSSTGAILGFQVTPVESGSADAAM
jgi:hypothetical protein